MTTSAGETQHAVPAASPDLAAGHARVAGLLEQLEPHDDRERADRERATQWVASTGDIWRREKPSTPSPHLVSYFLLVDPDERRLLLVDHRLAGLWLPTGGHVEPGEHPVATVPREAEEELGLREVTMLDGVPAPFFLTWTWTRAESPGRHVDVSFWFALRGRATQSLRWDEREFRSIRWWSFDEVRSADPTTLDPQMGRALNRLGQALT